MSQTQSPPFNAEHQHNQDPRAAFPNLEDYLAIKAACCTDYKDAPHPPPTDVVLKECAKFLSEWPNVRVIDRWKHGEAKGRVQAVIETAVRYMSGCLTFNVNPEAALFALDALLDPEYPKDDGVRHLASPPALARAHSCAAHAHYQKFTASDAERGLYASIDRHYGRRQSVEAGFGYPAHMSLEFALHHASESARRGLVSSAVLRVGFAAREIGEGFGVRVDCGELAQRARRYRPLWRAVGDRVDELYAEARRALEACRRDPLEYACGAEGCTTRAKSSASFKSCSGKCPAELKPRYCSKQCQVKDWSRHKAICKPGYGGKIPKIPDKSIALEWFELGDPEPEPVSTSAGPEAKSDLRAESVSDDLRLHDANPECVVDAKKPQKSCRTDTSEEVVQCAIHDHAIPVAEHAPRGAEDTPNVWDRQVERLYQNPDCAIPVSRPDDVQASGNGPQHTADTAKAYQDDKAIQESPVGEAVESAVEDAQGDVAMLLVTEHVFYGGDDARTRWSPCYLAMRTACFLDYRDARHGPSSDLVLESQCAKDIAQLTTQQVSERWKGSDSEIRPTAILEMALRFTSGTCTVKRRPNPEAALFVLRAFHDPAHDSTEYVGASAPQPDRARAHALAAHAHYQKVAASDAERVGWAADYWWRQAVPAANGGEGEGEGAGAGAAAAAGAGAREGESLQRALHHASESARLGLVSSIGVRLGLVAREIGHGFGVDVARRPLAARARRFRALWQAVDGFLEGFYGEAREAQAQVGRGDRREDVCGAEGCGTRARAGVGTGFKTCSGACPPDLKPRYCCKGCQVKDWARHKKICKPGSVGKLPKIPDRAIVLEWFELEEPESAEQETARETVPEAKSEANLPIPSPRNEDDIPVRAADDKKPREGDGAKNFLQAAAENAFRTHDERMICTSQDSQDVQDNDSTTSTQGADRSNPVPPGLSPAASRSRLDHAQADYDHLDGTMGNETPQQRDEEIQKTTEEAAERDVQDVVEDRHSSPEVEHASSGSTEDLQESEDSLSSPDSERPPSTPPGLLRGLPHPLVFGCISPEYLRKMCEEEGPGALMDTNVWALNPPAVFTARY